MLISILIALGTVLSLFLIRVPKIKSEYVFLLLFLGYALSISDSLSKTAVFIGISFAMFLMMKHLDVNTLIRSSFPIYVATIILLCVALILPAVGGSHRYVVLGAVAIEPASLVAFSALPICAIINKLKRITLKEFFLILSFAGLELALLCLQANLKPAIIMSITFFVLLVKAKRDKRINMSWAPVAALVVSFICGWGAVLLSPYARSRIAAFFAIITSRGMSDPLGGGYQLHIADMITRKLNFLGPCDPAEVGSGAALLNEMPLLSFASRYGILPLGLLLIAALVFILHLYFMSGSIKNTFARYVCFSVATYFAVGAIFQILGEFVTGSSFGYFMFLGKGTGLLIDSLLVAIAFSLYRKRGGIKVGRQPDIDYDMTDAVLKNFEDTLQEKLQSKTITADEKQQVEECLESVGNDRKDWKKGSKTLYEINQNYEKYEKSSSTSSVEKDLVFISYNHFDEKHAAYLASRVEQDGMKAWHFKRDMKAEGDTNDYAVAIRRALRRARVFVVILSSNSINSDHVKNEVCLAFGEIQKGTVIMPVIIERVPVEEDDTYGYYLCRQDITDAVTPPVKKQLDRFAKKIKSVFE